MDKKILIQLAYDLFGRQIDICQLQKNTETYSYDFLPVTEILPGQKYYVLDIKERYDIFSFTSTKSEDNLLKSFINQWLAKVDEYHIIDGFPVKLNKAQKIERLKNNDRVYKSYYYTTLYGIGFFCFLMNDKTFERCKKELAQYLSSMNVEYHNEYSEHRWAYRFVIKKSVEAHNELLNNFNI